MRRLVLGWVVLHGLLIPATYGPRQWLTQEISIQRCSYWHNNRLTMTIFTYYGKRK